MRIMRGRIEPLIRAQMTVPHRVRDRQLKQLNNVLNNLETAVDEKGPNGEKSCSDMETFLKPDEQLRSVCVKRFNWGWSQFRHYFDALMSSSRSTQEL